jgi:predicted NUDIX family NTP pyrophosphohydrolase
MVTPRSAGILLYRRTQPRLEVLLALPGGPFWRGRDVGAWQIPKGAIEAGEAPAQAARREVEEELGVALVAEPWPLVRIRQSGGKWVDAFALEQDVDIDAIVSATFELEWPPRSGRFERFPEMARADWFGLDHARRMILPSQAPLLEALEIALESSSARGGGPSR